MMGFQSGHGFADGDEQSLNQQIYLPIRVVVVEGCLSSQRIDALCGFLDIPKESFRIMFRRWVHEYSRQIFGK